MIKLLCKADDCLIDNICQPIADQFHHRDVSNFDIAKNLLIGSSVLHIAGMMTATGPISIISMVFAMIFFAALAFLCRTATIFDKVTKSGKTENPLRHGIQPMRIAFMVAVPVMIILDFNSIVTVSKFLQTIEIIIYVIAIYFLSCSNRPPKQKTFTKFAENRI